MRTKRPNFFGGTVFARAGCLCAVVHSAWFGPYDFRWLSVCFATFVFDVSKVDLPRFWRQVESSRVFIENYHLLPCNKPPHSHGLARRRLMVHHYGAHAPRNSFTRNTPPPSLFSTGAVCSSRSRRARGSISLCHLLRSVMFQDMLHAS